MVVPDFTRCVLRRWPQRFWRGIERNRCRHERRIELGATDGAGAVRHGASRGQKSLDSLGIQLRGYMRGGAYHAKDGLAKGHHGPGDLGYNRLGNEGDQYFEFGIGKKWDLSGAKLGTYWMPCAYRNTSHQE